MFIDGAEVTPNTTGGISGISFNGNKLPENTLKVAILAITALEGLEQTYDVTKGELKQKVKQERLYVG